MVFWSVLFQGVLNRVAKITISSILMVSVLSGIDDLFDVTSELEDVAVNWRAIGLALRLRDPDLGAIAVGDKSVYGCLTDMLRLWLNKSYDVIKYGEPSWQMLENAVRARAGGNNPAIADQIHRRYIA